MSLLLMGHSVTTQSTAAKSPIVVICVEIRIRASFSELSIQGDSSLLGQVYYRLTAGFLRRHYREYWVRIREI